MLDFGNRFLVVKGKEDDSIEFAVTEKHVKEVLGDEDVSQAEPWKNLLGKSFSWGWVNVNMQGYCDGILLAFGGVIPQVMFTVVASSIKVATVHRV